MNYPGANIKGSRRLLRQAEHGSALTEAAPALFLLLMCAIFPILDLISMGVSYAAASTLNDLQLREAVKTASVEAKSANGVVKMQIPANFRSASLLGCSIQDVDTQVSYRPGVGGLIYVTVTTLVTVRPLLIIPIFPNIPGLSAPLQYAVSSSKPLENSRFFQGILKDG